MGVFVRLQRLYRAAAVTGAAVTLAASAATFAAPAASAASAAVPPPLPAQAQGHPYRHGVVPPRGSSSAAPGRVGESVPGSYGSGPLYYGGGDVITGAPQVYLVFWGSQWGTQSTNSNGDLIFSGDPSGMAPYLQDFFKGLGTGADAASQGAPWSGIAVQYCEGAAMNTTSCASGLAHVGFPGAGGVLSGVVYDNGSTAPYEATAAQIAAEAAKEASGFGLPNNSTTAQVVVVSPTGTHPDGFNTASGQFCAWHDNTGDSSLGASYSPNVAFTNMPYVTDMGTSCGQDFVNSGSAGTLDGVSIVGGHEYAETLTDPFPSSGWVDSGGYEIGDKCAWIAPSSGGSGDLSLATGSFAVQSLWSNADNGCGMGLALPTTTGSLSLSGGPASAITAGATYPMTVATSAGTASVTLSGGLFSTSTSGTFTSTLTLAAATTGTTFYFEETAAGSDTITASAVGYSSASATESVNPASLASLTITPASNSSSPIAVPVGGSQTLTVTGKDAYGNVISGTTATWALASGGGSVQTGTTASTTYTAGSSAGSATVTATSGGVTSTAYLNVVSSQPMAVSVTAGKSSYNKRSRSYNTPLTATVTSNGGALSGASVVWTIYSGSCTTGPVVATSTTQTTNTSGQSNVTFSTPTRATYCALATVSDTGYTSTAGSMSFTN